MSEFLVVIYVAIVVAVTIGYFSTLVSMMTDTEPSNATAPTVDNTIPSTIPTYRKLVELAQLRLSKDFDMWNKIRITPCHFLLLTNAMLAFFCIALYAHHNMLVEGINKSLDVERAKLERTFVTLGLYRDECPLGLIRCNEVRGTVCRKTVIGTRWEDLNEDESKFCIRKAQYLRNL